MINQRLIAALLWLGCSAPAVLVHAQVSRIPVNDDCNLAAIGRTNVVRNSGFEAGMDGWAINRGDPLGSTHTTPTFVPPVLDTSTVKTGRTSLRIDNPNGGGWKLMSREFTIVPGQSYTVSLDAKSAQLVLLSPNVELDDGSLMLADVSNLTVDGVPVTYPGTRFQLNGGSDTSWHHLSETVTIAYQGAAQNRHRANLAIEFGISWGPAPQNSTIWLDNVQMLPGGDQAYLPRPLDLKLTGGCPYTPAEQTQGLTGLRPYTEHANDSVPMNFTVYNNNDSQPRTVYVHYTVTDEYYNTIISDRTTNTVTVDPRGNATSHGVYQLTDPNVSPLKRGKYILSAELWSDGVIQDRSHYDFAVIDSVHKSTPAFTEAFSVSDIVAQQGGSAMGPGGDLKDIWSLWNCSDDATMLFRAEAGDRWIRAWDFAWSHVEPTSGTWNWAVTDNLVQKAKAYGIQVMPVLGNEFINDNNQDLPSYVQTDPQSRIVARNPALSSDSVCLPAMARWKTYIDAVVTRYSAMGVHTYEVMNEPQMYMSVQDFLPYLSLACTEIKTIDPAARIVSFTASQDYGQSGSQYLSDCLNLGALQYADVVSFHPYSARLDWSQPTSQMAWNATLENLVWNASYHTDTSGNNKALWCDELYQLGPHAAGIDWDYEGRVLQGHEYARRYLTDLATGIGRSFVVQDMNYTELFHPTSTTVRLERTNGMMPSSCFVIYNTLTKLFEGATFANEVSIGATCKLYRYTGPGSVPIAATWCFDLNNTPLTLRIPGAAGKIKALDIMGNPSDQVLPSSTDLLVTLTNTPIYLQPQGVSGATFTSLLNASTTEAVLPVGKIISLKAYNGMYVCADQTGTDTINRYLVSNRTSVNDWEKFLVVDAGPGKVSLKAQANQLYVSADLNLSPAGQLIANRQNVLAFETFRWVNLGSGKVGLQASNNLYVSQGATPQDHLIANGPTAGNNQTFQWLAYTVY